MRNVSAGGRVGCEWGGMEWRSVVGRVNECMYAVGIGRF